jgi:hypothetical protein
MTFKTPLHLGIQVDVRRKGGRLLGPHIDGERGEASPLDTILEKEVLLSFGIKGPDNGNSRLLFHRSS